MPRVTPPPIPGRGEAAPPGSAPGFRALAFKVCLIIFAIALAGALVLFRIYGTDTHHSGRSSIWWTERGRNLIPPTATDITLRQDFLDHYAIYTVSTADLDAFLHRRFADPGEPFESFSKPSPAHPDLVGTTIGPLGWKVTESTVSGTYSASNGGAHHYYHDTKSGLTYQSSAYW